MNLNFQVLTFNSIGNRKLSRLNVRVLPLPAPSSLYSVWDDLKKEQSIDNTTSNSRTFPFRNRRVLQHSSTKSVRLCYLGQTSRTDKLLPSLIVSLVEVTPPEKGQQCGSWRQVARQGSKGLCHFLSRGFAIWLKRIDWNLQFKEFLDHFHKIVSKSILLNNIFMWKYRN